ncbi:unnamed protein product [Sordaria macrospora k-hell]|uniref:WGS project CABT00000000 data, contig 2.6 n=1 Tax=Sordaria macrospora (strain ATCC MYA-333 / DSM 997 / K(L3346) / K-hell) TaxID=771870 RepID=F7VTD9_SORMK|nr:uncharacterized protein SMAC_05951 [Sordaria macrospora k-hell]CCC08595.1 unnamed protein product [Sordaria macrospora k-hell]
MHYDHHGAHQCCPVNSMNKFTNFRRLPAELRNIIWEFSLPESRVYEVLDAPNSKQKTPPHEGLMFANIHPEPPPALAAVCRESRSFVLHNYKPLTLGRTTKYVDLSRDVLLLEPYLLVKRLHRTLHFMTQIPLLRDNINRLALGTSFGIYTGICHPVLSWKVSKTNMGKLLTNLAKFPRLKVLIFIVHQEFQFEFDFRFPGTMTPVPNHPLQHSVSTTLQPLFTTGPSATGFPSPMTSGSSSIISPSRSSSSNPIPTLAEPASNGLHFDSSSTVSNSCHGGGSNKNNMATRNSGGLYTSPYSSPLAFPSLPPPPLLYPYHHQQPNTAHNLPPPLLPLPLLLQQQHQQQQPQPPPQPQPQRPQLVHQAYRFKFDIEANINHAPRRPHLNELLYYPLDKEVEQEDKEDDGDDGESFDYYNFAGSGSGGSNSSNSGNGNDNSNGNPGWTNNTYDEDSTGDVRVGGRVGSGGSGGEWSDPWPTNDDWRRFRRRFQKAVRQSLEVMERNRLACLAAAEEAAAEVAAADGDGKQQQQTATATATATATTTIWERWKGSQY